MQIIYDGECPVCGAYVEYMRLKKSVGQVELINARDNVAVVQEALNDGMDVNDGMIVRLDGETYFGADAVHILAMLSTRSGAFNKLNAVLFRSKFMSRIIYPIMRLGRSVLLRMLGRRKIAH